MVIERSKRLLRASVRVVSHPALLAIMAVALGVYVGNLVFGTFIGKPSVGIIKIDSYTLPWTTSQYIKMVNYAIESEKIKAVVLEIDSPGREAVSTQELYLHVVELAKRKPVVAYVNIVAASGGYYITVPSDYIYVKPGSSIGSVGAYVRLPDREVMSEDIVWTGPFKATGSSRKEAMTQLQMTKEAFLQVVLAHRGERLGISKEEISKAAIYNGIEAVRFGLVDDIGSRADAIKKAAELGKLRNYDETDVNEAARVVTVPWYFYSAESRASEVTRMAGSMMPVFYYLYLPPEAQE